MRYRNKTYWRIPGGEIQYGHLSRTVTVWWRGKVRLRCSLFAAVEVSDGAWGWPDERGPE